MDDRVSCALCSSLGSNDGNFFPNTEEAKKNHAQIHFKQSKIVEDGITEDEILQQCFKKPTNVAQSKTECRRSLLDLCGSLLKQQPKSDTVVCNMCAFALSIKLSKYRMVNHACAHLEVKLFKCRHCGSLSSDDNKITSHIRRMHSISNPTSEDFEDKTIAHFDEITTRIKRCFSTTYPRASGLQRQFVRRTHCESKSQQSASNLCRSIFIKRSRPVILECNLCELRIILRRNFKACAMYQHAAAHLEVKLFSCRHCSKSVSTKHAITHHLKNSHQINDGNSDDFDDESEKYQTEYLGMIERCFFTNQVKVEVPSTKVRSSIKSEAAVRGLTTGSKQAVERRVFCTRLIRKAVDSSGKVKCSLCSKQINTRYSAIGYTGSTNALSHVESQHLKKPLYRCKVCGSPFSTFQTIHCHLQKKHALAMEKNHECMADEFHEEFMAMLAKCYVADG